MRYRRKTAGLAIATGILGLIAATSPLRSATVQLSSTQSPSAVGTSARASSTSTQSSATLGTSTQAPANAGSSTQSSAGTVDHPTQLAIASANLALVANSGGGAIAPNGAMGANASKGSWQSLGDQSPIVAILHAAADQSVPEMTAAMSALQYTYDNQQPNGSWADNTSSPPCPQDCNFTGTYFFYGDLGRGLGLLADSSWFRTSSTTSALRTQLEALRPKVQLGLNWLFAQPGFGVTMPGLAGNGDTNRPAAATEGAVLVGNWLGNSTQLAVGLQMLSTIEGAQTSDGTFLENRGFDAGYQTVTLNHLWDIYFHYQPVQTTLLPHILAGMQREQRQIMATFEINHSGSSRTGCPGGIYDGAYKSGSGWDLIRAMVYEAVVTDTHNLVTTAQNIANFYQATPQASNHCFWKDVVAGSTSATYAVTCANGRLTFVCNPTVGAMLTWSGTTGAVKVQILNASGAVLAQAQGADGVGGLRISVPATPNANYQVSVSNLSSAPATITLTATP